MKLMKCFFYAVMICFFIGQSYSFAQTDRLNDLSTEELFTSEIGAFRIGGQVYRVWASLRNKTEKSATRWQFRYDSLFLPEIKRDGSLSIYSKKINDKFRTHLTIILDSKEAADIAYAMLKNIYPDKVNEIQQTNVFAKPVLSIAVSIPELKGQHPQCEIIHKTVNFDRPAQEFTITIESPDEETAKDIESNLQNYRIDYQVSASSYLSMKNAIKVSANMIKDSNLILELDGLGSNEVYVHRDDMRKLLEDVNLMIEEDSYIENPESFKDDLMNKIKANYFTRVNASIASFDAEKWRSTYNGDDLKPNKIEESLNKEFKKNHEKKTWDRSRSLDQGSEASFIEIGSAKQHFKGSYSDKGLKDKLKQFDITAEFKGEKIIVKSIKLYRTNLAKFKSELSAFSIYTYVQPLGIKKASGSIDLFRLVGSHSAYPDIVSRVSGLEKTNTNYTGIIMPFAGTVDSIPIGWLLCDGSIKEKDGIFSNLFSIIKTNWGDGYGDGKTFNIPDLRGIFLRGLSHNRSDEYKDPNVDDRVALSGERIGNKLGSYQKFTTAMPQKNTFTTENDGIHRHKILEGSGKATTEGSYFDSVSESDGSLLTMKDDPNSIHSHSIKGGDLETIPNNVAVNYIIKY